MRAVHWVRTRQEERELTYWLSFVAYERRDRSLNNRIYLVYLILFFSIWVFMTLTLFASVGATLLHWINPHDPAGAAVFLETLALGVWSVFSLWQALHRSPIVFSEPDAVLICQTPVNRRPVTLRWLLMPWFENAIPFWLVAITLGFSLAEITMPGAIGASRILEYVGYGLRAWVAILPVHLALFSLQWVVGIYRLQRDRRRRWLAAPVMAAAIVLLAFLLFFALKGGAALFVPWDAVARVLLFPVRAGFAPGSLSIALLASGLGAAAILGWMYALSGGFSLSRAAQETQEIEVISSALRFGFVTYAQELQAEQRLGVSRAPTRLPAPAGAGILVWKDILQSQRSFRLAALFNWFTLFSVMLGMPFLPDVGSRALAVGVWVILIGRVCVVRLRSDLSRWSLVRQLPISSSRFILFEMSAAYLLIIGLSWAGLACGALLSGASQVGLAAILPGIAAGAAGMAAFDVIRRSRSNLLLNGSVPEVSAGGILLGLLFAAIPLFIYTLLPGIFGGFFAAFLSLWLGYLAFNWVVHSYSRIDAA